MQIVNVDLGDRSYSIQVGSGAIGGLIAALGRLPRLSQTFIVSSPTVHKAQLEAFALHWPNASQASWFLWPDGEQHKTLQELERVWTHLLQHQADRHAVLVAIGGGVVGDMAGFAAACYQRGIRFIQVPTTLLAMVDSSVGGKTGVNHPLGKNMIGAFHQPSAVICDVDTLDTLPEREYRSGLAEVIKYGAIADLAFFEQLEADMDELLARDKAVLTRVVARCCEVKAWVVAQDEREAGLREILNFGHTFGHAIETGLGYGAWLHGEAVAAGMCMGAELSVRLGLMGVQTCDRIVRLIQRAGLPVHAPNSLAAADYLPLMQVDKKARAGQIRYVVLKRLGEATTIVANDTLALASIEARFQPKAA